MNWRIEKGRRFWPAVPAALGIALTAVLSGCSSDEGMSRFLVAPGKYVLYSCPELATEASKVLAHKRQLEGLMARAAVGSGGDVVNAVAYRPEYLVAEGDLRDLHETALAKKCPPLPTQAPAEGVSDTSIR